MTAEELQEWQAYAQLEPFGPEMDFWRAGMIAATIANVNRKKGKKPYTAEDFMPRSIGKRKRRKAQTPDEMLNYVRCLGVMYG